MANNSIGADRRNAILGGLDDLFQGSFEVFERPVVDGSIQAAKRISANTSDKAYRQLTAHANVTSYSLLSELHRCPRAFELQQFYANRPEAMLDHEFNPDFAYGHAVGAGIQTYAATNDLIAAQFAAFMAWKGPFDAQKVNKSGDFLPKSLPHAIAAVEEFQKFWDGMLQEYDILTLPSGLPAVELSFCVDFENGYFHFGHIDAILIHRQTKRLVVWEGKTTGYAAAHEAMYANSTQGLSYSVVLDAVALEIGADSTDYEVYYIVHSATSRDFQLYPFTKSRTQRAEWMQDILFDHATIDTYRKVGLFPKRGENCYAHSFRRPCKYFGTCNISNENLFPGVTVPILSAELVNKVESVDFRFKLSDLIAAQKGIKA